MHSPSFHVNVLCFTCLLLATYGALKLTLTHAHQWSISFGNCSILGDITDFVRMALMIYDVHKFIFIWTLQGQWLWVKAILPTPII